MNIIEGPNRQFSKITQNKPSFTNDDSLKKMLYLAVQKITGHWTARCKNWDVVSNYLGIIGHILHTADPFAFLFLLLVVDRLDGAHLSVSLQVCVVLKNFIPCVRCHTLVFAAKLFFHFLQ